MALNSVINITRLNAIVYILPKTIMSPENLLVIKEIVLSFLNNIIVLILKNR